MIFFKSPGFREIRHEQRAFPAEIPTSAKPSLAAPTLSRQKAMKTLSLKFFLFAFFLLTVVTLPALHAQNPSVALSTATTTVDSDFVVTVTFNEDIDPTTFDEGDFDVANGAASSLAGTAAIYSIVVTPTGPGNVIISLPMDAVLDLDESLGNTASNLLTLTFEPSTASILSLENGDFSTPVLNTPGIAGGNIGISYDPLTDSVLYNEAITGVASYQWIQVGGSKGWTYDEAGGADGTGAMGVEPAPKNQKPRCVLYFADDNRLATGVLDLSVDLFLDDNSMDNDLTFTFDLYGWNDDQSSPQLSWGGPVGNDPAYNVTELFDSTTVISMTIAATDFSDEAWESVLLGSPDVGDGFDNYVFRVGILGATDGDVYGFDNLAVAGGVAGSRDLQITEISYDVTAATVKLTWISERNTTYAIDISTDLENWQELEDGVQSDGLEKTYSFSAPSPRVHFFKVRKEL